MGKENLYHTLIKPQYPLARNLSRQQILAAHHHFKKKAFESRARFSSFLLREKSWENFLSNDILNPFKSFDITANPTTPPLPRVLDLAATKEWVFKNFRYDDNDQVFLNGIDMGFEEEDPLAPLTFVPDFYLMPKKLVDEVPFNGPKYSNDIWILSSGDDVVKEFLNRNLF